MSLSRPVAQSPSARFYDWSGSRGALEWWDKEKKERMTVALPFKFIVLDELHTVTGYSDQDQSGIWANETRTTREDFTVRTKRGVKYVGTYKNGQGINQVAAFGGKYAKSVYIAHRIDGEWVIGNMKLAGVALTAWIELNSSHRTEGNIIVLTGSTDGKKGATEFKIPTFEYNGAPDSQTLEIATDLDAQLQAYLDTYLTAPKFDENAEPVNDWDNDDTLATPAQVAEFEQKRDAAASKAAPSKPDVVIEDISDEPINLDDIPF